MIEAIFDIQNRLEQTTVFTPLGIRFWDQVRDTQVSDSLMVIARPATIVQGSPPAGSPPDFYLYSATAGSVTTAFRTASGVYAFQGLPGLHDVEYPVGELALEASPPNKRYFIIEVKDEQRRFLPTVFGVELPLDYRGVFLNGISPLTESSPPIGSPPFSSPPGFYLFSAPTRATAPGLAAVRGCLVEASTERPAAYAVLEVQVNGKTWYGVADERGCVAVLFPYPTFINTPGLSPPDTLRILPLQQQKWELTIRVRFNPDTLYFPLGEKNSPDLRTILKQSPGVIWRACPQSPIAELPVEELSLNLVFGRELVLQTANLSTTKPWGLPRTELWISPT